MLKISSITYTWRKKKQQKKKKNNARKTRRCLDRCWRRRANAPLDQFLQDAFTSSCNPYIFFWQLSRDMTKPTQWVCAQRRLWSDWADAQSDQSLRCALNGKLRTQTFFVRTAKTLISLGGCPGWSESSLGTHSLCWFCNVAPRLYLILSMRYFIHFTIK